MIRIKYEQWLIDLMLDRPDGNGEIGTQYLKDKGIIFTGENPQYHIAKEGFWTYDSRFPKNKTIFMRIELPFILPSTYVPGVTNGYMAVLDPTTEYDKNSYYFTEPQDHKWIDRYFNSDKRENLICILTGDMDPKGPEWRDREQRSLRRELIRHFSDKMGEDFHHYGRGWVSYGPGYKGYAEPYERKHEVLSWYKFNVALEGERYDGYVSEKIWQAMASGCIPIYSGPKDIDKYIPNDLYIDFRDRDLDKLYNTFMNMNDEEREGYRSRIWDFLHSSDMFSSVRFAKIIEKIFKDRNLI